MCCPILSEDLGYNINFEVIDLVEEENNNWPIEIDQFNYVFSCRACYYPILHYRNVRDFIYSERLVSVVGLVRHILSGVFPREFDWDIEPQWFRRVLCYNCGNVLSHISDGLPLCVAEYRDMEKIIILNSDMVIFGSTEELHHFYVIFNDL